MLKKDLYSHKNEILKICENEGIQKLFLFGSTSREESNSKSDIDFLVEFKTAKSLFKIIALKHKLEDLLQNDVDILTPDSLSPYFKNNVLKEAEIFYEA
ncbi:MAG: nucleotidyltransferase family protein [Cetobacterium sp.]